MNRPLWLDLIYIASFFVPPTLVAAFGAFGLSKWLELSGWIEFLAYAVLVILAIALWVIGLIAWNRIASSRAKEDVRANRDGN